MGCFSGRGAESAATPPGSWVKCSKEQIKRMLREKSIRILLCTDAAGEGSELADLRPCVVANFDLPWNPMKVEQRIGRIDRIGQKYTKVIAS